MIPSSRQNCTNTADNNQSVKNCLNYFPSPTFSWLLPMELIEPGKSTILGGNKVIFYGIHFFAIFIILLSISASLCVISNVWRNFKNQKKSDFSDRFPLYISICDVLWGISNLSGDHVVLMIHQEFPSKELATSLSINLFFFFGYQQLMNAGLSLHTYLKVVRNMAISLGYWEWRLHVSVFVLLVSQIVMYWYLDAFGNGGFWFFIDLKTGWGSFFGAAVCTVCTAHATLTLLAYRSIQNVISDHKRLFSMYTEPLPPPRYTSAISRQDKSRSSQSPARINRNSYIHQQTYSTATNCLTTFIYISICLYFPLALVAWVGWAIAFYGYLDPLSALGVIAFSNSGGWVNAWGYFHNRKIKERRKTLVNNAMRPNNSSSSTV